MFHNTWRTILPRVAELLRPNQKKLLGVLKAKKVPLYMPLLKWYIEHGLKITAVYRTIDYVPRRVFYWFVHEVANMRRKGDAEADKALLAEIYKLLGNSAYGKFIEAVERQTNVLYTKRRRRGRQAYAFCLFRRSRRDRRRVQDRITQKKRSKSIDPSRWVSWYISWPSCECYSSTTTSWTSTSTGETSSLSKWTPTVFTSPFRMTLWRKQ